MKTIYTKDGKPIQIAQDLDAHIAIQTGKYFATPPGQKAPLPKAQQVSKASMASQQLVDYAKDEFGADLDPLLKRDTLEEMIKELEEAHKDSNLKEEEEKKPKPKTRKKIEQ